MTTNPFIHVGKEMEKVLSNISQRANTLFKQQLGVGKQLLSKCKVNQIDLLLLPFHYLSTLTCQSFWTKTHPRNKLIPILFVQIPVKCAVGSTAKAVTWTVDWVQLLVMHVLGTFYMPWMGYF